MSKENIFGAVLRCGYEGILSSVMLKMRFIGDRSAIHMDISNQNGLLGPLRKSYAISRLSTSFT